MVTRRSLRVLMSWRSSPLWTKWNWRSWRVVMRRRAVGHLAGQVVGRQPLLGAQDTAGEAGAHHARVGQLLAGGGAGPALVAVVLLVGAVELEQRGGVGAELARRARSARRASVPRRWWLEVLMSSTGEPTPATLPAQSRSTHSTFPPPAAAAPCPATVARRPHGLRRPAPARPPRPPRRPSRSLRRLRGVHAPAARGLRA